MTRRPLGPIAPNIIRRKKLTSFQRGILVGQAAAGSSTATIRKLFSLPESTIRTTLSNAEYQPDGKTRPRSGQPKATDERDERNLLRLARLDLKQTYADLITRSGVTCGKKTVYRIFSHTGITN